MISKLTSVLRSIFSASEEQDVADVTEGGLYLTPHEQEGYTVLKVLKIDNDGVHIRTFSNLFHDIPKVIDESTLFMAGMGADEDTPMGMGHTPISHSSFITWGLHFVQQSAVSEDDLEGYKMWAEANGGYF